MPSSAAFNREVLKVAVAQICHSLGWNSLQKTSLRVLTDILERYIKKLSTVVAGHCQHSLRTDINLNDLGLAFDQLGVQICELEDYVHQVESINLPKPLPKVTAEPKSIFNFPSEEEIASREDWYETFLPVIGKALQKKDEEVTVKEEEEEMQIQMQTESSLPATEVSAQSPTVIPKKRPAESPPFSPIEPKKPMMENQLFLPNLVRPAVPSFSPSTESPMTSKQAFIPFPSPNLPPCESMQNSDKKTDLEEKKSPALYQERSMVKEQANREVMSPDGPSGAKRPKLTSPSDTTGHRLFKESRIKDEPKRHESLSSPASKNDSRDAGLSQSPTPQQLREPLTSPLNKLPPHIKSPLSEKLQTYNSKGPNIPLLQSPITQPVPKPNVITALSEKKPKKSKKAKKSKEKITSSADKKSKASLGASPQLFASPHVLKSPPEPKSTVIAQSSIKASPRPEHRPYSILSPSQMGNDKMSTTPESRNKTSLSNPTSESMDTKRTEMKSKKGKKKGSFEKIKKKTDKTSSKSENKDKTPLFERQQIVASLPLKKIASEDDSKSSPSVKSPTLSSPRFSVAVSHASNLSSPEYRTPETKFERSKKESSELSVTKGDERKKKKDKKKKNEEAKAKKSSSASKTKKSDTPSLKLTFKRAPSGSYQDQSKKESSSIVKIQGVSPDFSSPIQTPSPKVISPPPPTEQISQKAAKVKTQAQRSTAQRSTPKVKKQELGVRIEPLVINDSYNEPDEYEEEPYERTKQTESKKGSKKVSSGKKGRPPKKAEAAKKTPETSKKSAKKIESPKKSETTRRSSTSSKSDVYQPDQYFTSPQAVPSAGEQSVSRGLYIQTITEPTTAAQVWYCPACLRPDDGSPMIGCDSCDGWYHWTCVGITEAPSEDVEWYCGTCVERLSKKKVKKRKKKD